MKGKVRAGQHRGERVFIAEGRGALTGKRRRFYGDTKAEAEAKQKQWNKEEQEAEDEAPLNPACDPDVTVAAYAAQYLARRDPARTDTAPWRPKTFRSHQDALERHVLPFVVGPGTVGEHKVRQWHRRWVPLIAEAKRAEGYARDSVRIMVQAASQLLSRAVEDELLRHHPLDLAARARIREALRPTAAEKATRETTVRCFNPYENGDGTLDVPTFLAVARERSALYPLYLTGFLSGLRLGELCGLKLDDDQRHVIDGKRARQLRVERQLGQDQRSLRAPAPTPTKTGKGRRLVDVADALGAVFDDIKAERKRLILERGWPRDTAWMSCTGNGTPYSEGNVERDFRGILRLAWPKRRATDPDPPQWDLTPHSMRHTFAVTHILDGCDAQWLKQQMGHSSIAVTLDVYGDWFQKRDDGQANRGAGRLLGDKVGDKRG